MMRRIALATLGLLLAASAQAQGVSPGGGGGGSTATLSSILGSPSAIVGGNSLTCSTGSNCIAQPEISVLGQTNLPDFVPGWVPGSATSNVTNIQNWLNAAYVQFVNLNPTQDLQNLARLSCIKAVIPKSANIYVDSPIIVPPGICTDFEAMIVRKGTAGTITANYTGDTTSQALANVYQPMVIYTPGSHNIGRLEMMLNSTGTDGGSGASIGRTWSMMTLTPVAAGSGFVGGEVCTVANGDPRAPYSGAQFTVATASGGAVTGITYSPSRWDKSGHSGIYPFPILMQKLLWTAANGWTSTRAVFDGSGNYLTNCTGTGSGLTVSAVMYPDWCTGSNGCTASTTYHGFFSNYSPMYGWYGIIKATQSRNTTDASFGGTFGVLDASYDHRFDEYYSQLANQGIVITGSDWFGNRINTSGNGIGLTLQGGGNGTSPNVVLNNDTQQYLRINNEILTTLKGSLFTDTGTTPTIVGQSIGLGDTTVSTASENSSLNLDFTLYNAGVAAGVPAVSCAYTRNSKIALAVTNIGQNGLVYAGPNNEFVNFGTDCQASNAFSGSIDNVSGQLWTGSMPTNVGFNVFDAAVPVQPGTLTATIGGTVTTGDVVTSIFTNAKLTGLPSSAAYTTIGGDTTTSVATGLAAAINANATLTGQNIIATSATNVVTVSEAGYWTFNTVATSSVSGSATETVTYSNSGVPSGATNGGTAQGSGVYALWSNTNPVPQTGIGKATAGSTLVNTNNGTVLGSFGTAAAPYWAPGVFSTPKDTAMGGSIAIGSGSQSGISSAAAYKNTSVGYQTLFGTMTTAALGNTVGGFQSGKAVTSGAGNAFWGDRSGQGDTTGSFNVGVGEFALSGNNGGNGNVGIGLNGCDHVNGGNRNVCLGNQTGHTTLSSGSDNIIIATTSAGDVVTGADSNKILIGGLLSWSNASIAAPVVSACGTNTIDAHANNATGTVSITAGAPASCTITFAGTTPYQTWDHCTVTSEAVNAAFAYSYTTTAITLTGTALAGKFDYSCQGY